MSHGGLEKIKRYHGKTLRERGWALTYYEADISMSDTDNPDEFHNKPVINDNATTINGEMAQIVGL
jgi:hypothetical protein